MSRLFNKSNQILDLQIGRIDVCVFHVYLTMPLLTFDSVNFTTLILVT